MSKTATRELPCRACGVKITALTIESANPARHPPFQEKLLARTLLKTACPGCGAEHEHYDQFVWTDLVGRLCVAVVHQDQRERWPELEKEARTTLAVPLREEGPSFVRSFGRNVLIRLCVGLEELREKVVCRVEGLDDVIVEALKLRVARSAVLESAVNGDSLTFLVAGKAVVTPWSDYVETERRRGALAGEFPGLFDKRSAWVNVARARFAPEP